MKVFISILSLIFVVITCSENSDITAIDKNKVTQHGNDSTDSYCPNTIGTWWIYTSISQGKTLSSKSFITGEDIINNKKYTIISNDQNNDVGYSRIEGNDYISILNFPGVAQKEVVQMKINPSIGDDWYYDFFYNGVFWRYYFQVIDLNLTRAVGNLAFDNVAKIKLTWYINPGYPNSEEWFATNDFFYYYAKGIGMIEIDGGDKTNMKITDYFIK
jgi:hypothetical protein